MRTILFAASIAAMGAMSTAAAAQDWEVKLTPYVWLAFPKGDVQLVSQRTGGGLSPNPGDPLINAEFEDVKLSGAFTGAADVRYGRFGLFGDLSYYEIETDNDITVGPLPAIDGKLTVSGTKGLIAGYWRAYESEQSNIDLLAGMHFFGAEIEAELTTAQASHSAKVERDMWDPVIGVRGETRFSKHMGVKGFAAYGGGGDSESLYELQGYLTWRFSDRITALAGYRYYSTKWDGERIKYDASFSGPLAGLTFTF